MYQQNLNTTTNNTTGMQHEPRINEMRNKKHVHSNEKVYKSSRTKQ